MKRPGASCAHCNGVIVKQGRYAGKAGVVHDRCWFEWLTTSDDASSGSNWRS